MNKGEFVRAIAEKSDLTIKQAQDAFDAGLETLTKLLKKGDKLAIVGFGTFELKKRAARTGINPQTKKTIKIPAAKVPAFKISKAWKESFN